MKICIFSNDYNYLEIKKRCEAFIHNNAVKAVENIYVTGYGWPEGISNDFRMYPIEGRLLLRLKIVCNILSFINKSNIIPNQFACFFLFIIKKELVRTFISFDSDVILCNEIKHIRQLQKLIQTELPYLKVYNIESKNRVAVNTLWRKYDLQAKVSIVLPTYNGAKYLRQSIESCLNQTHNNIELIIIDDDSKDNTAEIVKSYNDPRILYIKHEINKKLPSALNTGFKNSSGKYLTWTSHDNIYKKNAIEEMVKFINTYEKFTDFVYTDMSIIDEIGNDLGIAEGIDSICYLRKRSVVGACFLYKRDILYKIGNYDDKFLFVEDYDYWLRVNKYFKMQLLRVSLYCFREHVNSLTSKIGENRKKIIKKVQKYNR